MRRPLQRAIGSNMQHTLACIVLLVGCATAMDIRHGLRSSPSNSKIEVSVDLFSGRPNPTWKTDNRDALKLFESVENAKWIDFEDTLSMLQCIGIEDYLVCDGKIFKEFDDSIRVADGITVDPEKAKSIASTAPAKALEASFLDKKQFDELIAEMFQDSSSSSAHHHLESAEASGASATAEKLKDEVQKRLEEQDKKVKEITGYTPEQLDELSQNPGNPKQQRKLKGAIVKLNETFAESTSASGGAPEASSAASQSLLQESLEIPPMFDHTWDRHDNCLNYAANIRLGRFGVPGTHGLPTYEVKQWLNCLFGGGVCRYDGKRNIVSGAHALLIMDRLMKADGFHGPIMNYALARAFANTYHDCHVVAAYLAPPRFNGGPFLDYHWIREDRWGWSHKGGSLPPVPVALSDTIPMPRRWLAPHHAFPYYRYTASPDNYVWTGFWAFCWASGSVSGW